MQDREIVKERIKRRLLAIKGIGLVLANKAAIQTMDELDRIILEMGSDDDLVKLERPAGIDAKFNYLFWCNQDEAIWVSVERPDEVTPHGNLAPSQGDLTAGVRIVRGRSGDWRMRIDTSFLDRLPETNKVEEQIVRLV